MSELRVTLAKEVEVGQWHFKEVIVYDDEWQMADGFFYFESKYSDIEPTPAGTNYMVFIPLSNILAIVKEKL